MEELNIFALFTKRDTLQREKNTAGKRIVEIRQALYAVDESLSRLSVQAKSEACLLPKDRVSNADKLKNETEAILLSMEEVVALRARQATLEQQKLYEDYRLHQTKDDIETISSKIAVWETQQKREIALIEEHIAQLQYDTQKTRLKHNNIINTIHNRRYHYAKTV